MPFFKVEVTPEESWALLLRDEELSRVYQLIGGGRIAGANPHPPRYWYVNEEEGASFCLLCSGEIPGYSPKHLYVLRINENYIIFELIGFEKVRFLHNSSLLDNELYRVKYLILAGLNSVGYWGLGITDTIDLVLDPDFEFAHGIGC